MTPPTTPDRFSAKSVASFLDEIASGAPTPGGGTGSALAAALAYSLLEMACAVAAKRAQGLDAENVGKLLSAARAGRDGMVRAMTDDSDGYDSVRAAGKAIKEQGLTGEAAGRLREEATRRAAGVPLAVARGCREGLDLSRRVHKRTRPATRSDVGVAVALFRAAAVGAACNVVINLVGTLPAAEESAMGRAASAAVRGAEHAGRGVARRLARQLGLRMGRK